MINVYGFPNTRATRVTWMLEELGAEYEYHLVKLRAGEHLDEAYRAINPLSKVPAIVDGDLAMSESAAICIYLGDRFPESGLVPPAGSPERARHDQWAVFAVAELEQPLWTIAKHRFVHPKEHRVADVIDVARWEFPRAAKALARGLGSGAFILGESFSAADVLLGHTLSWARNVIGDLGDDALEAYADRVLGRPALERARAREEAAAEAAGIEI